MNDIARNLETVREEIEKACARAGRSPEEVRLMAVTKTKPRADADAAYEAGVRLFGENRIFEARDKYAEFPTDAELHLIGHMQTNKAKTAAEIFSCVQSVDKTKSAAELEKRCASFGKSMDILLEVNTSGEESKYGFTDENALFRELEGIVTFKHLNVRGLMTIAPFTDDESAVRGSFRKLKELYDKTAVMFPDLRLDTLSMGMSSDFGIAVEEGSTLVRIGSVIFGERR
jgi:hypothetical protein